MKKTVIVNINGIIFHIDEDAYAKLGAYLDALHRYFDQQTEGKEIVFDIESRIAELLQPLINETKQSVILEDIESIITTLGTPEDIAGEGDNTEENKTRNRSETTTHRRSRRLYRDVDNTVIGGVCSGIAAYFDIDPLVVRIIFIALLFAGGISIFVYPILWIVLPAAKTAAQKLEMRGEQVTINNIERTYHNTGQIDPDSTWGRIRSFLSEVFAFIGKVFNAIWKVITFLVGIFFIFLSVVLIISLIAVTFFDKFYINDIAGSTAISIKEIMNMVISPGETTWILFILLLVVFIPLLGLMYAGLKLVIRFKAKDKWVLLSLFLLWIVAVITGTILISSHVSNYRVGETTRETVALAVPKRNVIYLASSKGNDQISGYSFPSSGLFGIEIKNNKKEIWSVTRIDIVKSLKATPELEIVRNAQGISREDAINAAKQVKVGYTLKDSSIIVDPTFTINQGKWKFQRARVILHLPVGMKVYIDPSTGYYLDNVSNINDYWDESMTGKTWQMTENGLELQTTSSVETHELKNTPNHCLYFQKHDIYSVSDNQLYSNEVGHVTNRGEVFNFKVVDVDIRKSDSNTAKLQIEKQTAWIGNSDEKSTNQNITYFYEQKDSILWLDPIFLFPRNEKSNDRKVKLTVYLPIDYKIFFGQDMEPLMKYYTERNNIDKEDFVNKRWKMTLDGLKEIEEKKEANE